MDNLHKKQKLDNCSNNTNTNTNNNNTSNVNITTNNELSKKTFNIYYIPFNMYPEDNKPVGSVNIAKIPSYKDFENIINLNEFIM